MACNLHACIQANGEDQFLSTLRQTATHSFHPGLLMHAINNYICFYSTLLLTIPLCLSFAACRVKDTLKKVTGKGHEHEVSKAPMSRQMLLQHVLLQLHPLYEYGVFTVL
jgi:hypothetical protein